MPVYSGRVQLWIAIKTAVTSFIQERAGVETAPDIKSKDCPEPRKVSSAGTQRGALSAKWVKVVEVVVFKHQRQKQKIQQKSVKN